MKNNYFKDLLKDIQPEKQLTYNSKILVVDSMNTFLRCFSIIPAMNPQGHHIGGLVGFLKSLGFAIKTIQPTRVILVFDGKGGSDMRRNLYPEYKNNRGSKRVTKWEGFDTQDDESDSMANQMGRLIDYLEELPVSMVAVDKVEADDVIAYISQKFDKINSQVTIMSSDQDFLQLVNDNISVYSPTKKKIYNKETVKNEYGIYPQNFLSQKILMGDSADNVPGVHGLGIKKLFKLFPELKEDKDFNLENIYQRSLLNPEVLLYSKILNFKYQLDINKILMDLKNLNIPEQAQEQINETINNNDVSLNIGGFMKMYEEDQLTKNIMNVDIWLNECFRSLHFYSQNNKN